MPLKKNIISNYLSQGWSALMGLAFVPLYIKYLGMEAYGLIGVFAVLQGVLTLLDMGMTPTLTREMARFKAGVHTSQTIRELMYSLVVISVGIVIVIASTLWITSDWLAQNWLHAEKLPLSIVSKSIAIMGIIVALRFFESIYRGAILGLQTQVWLNSVNAILATARGLGAVGILVWVSPSIEAFFIWQVCISLVTVLTFSIHVHRVLPPANHSVNFSISAISSVWGFARGMIATTLFSLILTQADKILLSRILNLESFGMYTLAATVANVLMLLGVPLVQSYYPRFTELHERQNEIGLAAAYHQGSQLMTAIIVPAALILILHGETVLHIWTGNYELSRSSSSLLALLALGTVFLGLMNIPYMLQLAHGWSMFAAKVNAVLVVILIPVLLWAVPRYGVIGAAWVWVAITSSYIFIVIHIMHRRILPKEKWVWYWQDTILPMASASFIGVLLSSTVSIASTNVSNILWLIFSGFAMVTAAVLAAPDLRYIAFKKLKI